MYDAITTITTTTITRGFTLRAGEALR